MHLWALFTISLSLGCHHSMQTISLKDYSLESLPKNQQISGHFKLRGTGLKRVLGSIEFDVIAKDPHQLYLSIDSFFNQPARIVTYDGQNLYGIEEDKLEAILNLPIEPEELVEILLRNYSHNPKEIKKMSTKNNQIFILYHSENSLLLDIDPRSHDILKRELRNHSNQLIYSVTYEDFPKRFYLEANYKHKKHAMILSSEDVKLNQGTFNEQLFCR